MADNFTLNNTNVSGGPTYRDLDRAGVRTQVVQLDLGGAASEVLAAGSVPVSGTVSVGNFPATQAVSGPVTDTQLRATALAISGTVNTGGLTDTQLRATAVAMSAASLPLPAGAGTEATLAGVRTDLGTDGTTPPAVLGAGTGVRGWLRSIYEKLTGTLAVTGTFFQATQPVSGPVTDTQLRATAVPISGTVTANAGTGTLAVSLAANTPDVTDRAARLLGVVASVGEARAAPLAVVIAGGANAIATLSLPAAGAGLFHYITYLHISRVATAALAGGAILTVTSTNLPGSLTWRTGNTMAIVAPATGTVVLTDMAFARPLRSAVANTATTVVGPAAGAAVSWHIQCHYFTAA